MFSDNGKTSLCVLFGPKWVSPWNSPMHWKLKSEDSQRPGIYIVLGWETFLMIGTSFCVLAYIIIGNYGYVKLRINFNTASERKKK